VRVQSMRDARREAEKGAGCVAGVVERRQGADARASIEGGSGAGSAGTARARGSSTQQAAGRRTLQTRERAPESAPPFPLSDASCGCRSRRVVVSCAGSIQARAPLAGSAFGSSVCCALLVRRRGLLLDRRRHRAQHSTQRCWAAAAHPSFARRQHPGGHRPPCTSSCGPTRRLSATLRRRV
jgi:hypothetical protein